MLSFAPLVVDRVLVTSSLKDMQDNTLSDDERTQDRPSEIQVYKILSSQIKTI